MDHGFSPLHTEVWYLQLRDRGLEMGLLYDIFLGKTAVHQHADHAPYLHEPIHYRIPARARSADHEKQPEQNYAPK